MTETEANTENWFAYSRAAGGIIDVEEGALRAANFEPVVLRTVDLHQFARVFKAIARLVDLPAGGLAISPDASAIIH